ncbi:molybdopterin-dependent oxidoreductase [Streptomyces sp. NPDC088785]|uniref:molybdopterin-dependent oxidoreductase n=1 Tax=Streptomyces sp. NPDC088785 TaxID=3365897 RepID=UPI0038090E8B
MRTPSRNGRTEARIVVVEERRGFCTLCKSRCGAVYTVEDGRITGVRPDPGHPTGAALCPKGRAAPEIAHSSRRLTTPLRRTNPKTDPDPGWEEIGWDEALDEIAHRMRDIAAGSGPEAVAFAVATPSGTMVSDATEWIERLVRGFGTPNTVYSAEICNWHKDVAHTFTFGTPLPPPDYAHTDLALLWGFNPAKTWLAQATALSAAQAAGATLAVVDPRRSTSALTADHWLRVRPGTDAALALGLAHLLIERDGHDDAFVRAWTNGPLLVRRDDGRFLRARDLDPEADDDVFAVFDVRLGAVRAYDTRRPAVRLEDFALRGEHTVRTRDGDVLCRPAFEEYATACAAWPADRVARTTWIPEDRIRALAERIARAASVSYYGWTGVGQSANATQTERALATLYALTGSHDRRGGNRPAPPPPHRPASGPARLAPAQRAKALGLDRHPLGPQASGYVNAGDLCTAIESGEPYRVRALIGFGSNLVVSQPGSDRVARALRDLEFQVHLDLFPNPTSDSADIVLPVNSAYEHEALRFGFETGHHAQEHVQLRPRLGAPLGASRSDTEVVFDLARRLGLADLFFGGDIEAAWDWQLEPLGLTAARLREHEGPVRVPRPEAERRYAHAHADGTVVGFATPTRRVELYSERLRDHGHPPVPVHTAPDGDDPAFPLVLTCAKHGTYVHSQHRGVSSLRRRAPEPRLDVHPDTAAAHGLADGDLAEVATRRGAVRLRVRFDSALHPAVVVGEYGWWQSAPDLALPGHDPTSAAGANYNLLVGHEVRDPLSGSVPLRAAACALRAVPGEDAWNGTRPFTVTALRAEAPGVLGLRLAPADGGALPDYAPGRYLGLRGPHTDTPRCYSLTGPGTDPGRTGYDLAVRHVPGGAFSTYVHEELRVGDLLDVSAPGGLFRIPVDLDAPVVLLAGGIGVTPFVSYVETLAATGGRVPEVVLHHGSRDGRDHCFRARLRMLSRRVDRLTVVDHYAEPGPGDLVGRDFERTGFVTAADIDGRLLAARARFYLCGPPAMIDSLTAGLLARGVPPFEIFAESFRAERPPVRLRDDAEFRVRLARSGKELTWRAADGTLLQWAAKSGVPMAGGCRVGQCESCACTVLDGSVTHLVRLSGDLPDDRALVCQAVPASDITLDA